MWVRGRERARESLCLCLLPLSALQPENLLLHHTGHVLLTDFDLSYGKGVTTPKLEKKPEGRLIKV